MCKEKDRSGRLYRGQPKRYDNCLLVPSALQGYWPKHYPHSGIGCCNNCMSILKTEKFLQDLGIDTAPYKRECETIARKQPFQDCAADIPYIFWLSIVFCEYKFSHMGKNMSFRGGGPVPYTIDMGFDDTDENFSSKPILCAGTVEDYAVKIAQCYFEHTPPDKADNFIRMYMDHQHYCKDSMGYVPFPKAYKTKNGGIVDGNDLPDHFTFLLDWTESRNVAEEFAKPGGTIVSIDSGKYDALIGTNYKMSYDDEEIGTRFSIDTADRQKSVVTFWPWTFTINELEKNEFGCTLDFKREVYE